MRILYTTKTIYYLTLSAIFLIISNIAIGQTIVTDRPDYPPGDTVFLTGSGWTSGETVTLQVIHPDMPGDNDSSEAHQPWEVVADGDGNLSSWWQVPFDEDEGDAQLEVLADGQSSGLDVSRLAAGIYLIAVQNDSGRISTKLIKGRE